MEVIRPEDRGYEKFLRRLGRRPAPNPKVREAVCDILGAVAREGDEAVVRFNERFGGQRLEPSELRDAHSRLSKEVRKAILSARANVRAFARRSLRRSWFMKNRQGAIVGERFDP